jgi:TonB family protein
MDNRLPLLIVATVVPAIFVSPAIAQSPAPTADPLIMAYYPAAARTAGIEGAATLMCSFTAQSVLQSCKLTSENPKGYGFGDAALKLADLSQPNLKVIVPERRGPLPFTFRLNPPSITPNTLEPLHIIQNPDWQVPLTAAQVAAARPKSTKEGHVVVDCVVTVAGDLDACKVAKESPTGAGFGEAALKLATLIKMKPQTLDGVPRGGAPVSIPFAWPSLRQPLL